MTSSTTSPKPVSTRPNPYRFLNRLAAFTPLWVLVAVVVIPSGYLAGITSTPPDWLGIPLGVAFVALAMIWMLIGVAIVWYARSRLTESLALMIFTIPATVLVVFAHAIILIMQNLG